MAYIPNNLTEYTAALSGCLSGLVASHRRIGDVNANDYQGYGLIAGAFAQSFDTVWGSAAPDTFQVMMIEKACKAVWENRQSSVNTGSLSQANYTTLCQAIIALIQAGESYLAGQSIIPLPWPANGGSSQPILPFTSLFINPVSGNDSNNGTTALTPLKTTAKANSLLIGRMTAALSITYQAEDTGLVELDLSQLNQGDFNIVVNMTPVTVHTGGTINAGTVAINPTAGGGGQRQQIHTTDILDWGPFIVAGGGGTATNPCRIVDSVTGAGAWVGMGVGVATADCARPVNPNGTAGTVTIGNAYTVQRPGIITVGSGTPISTSGTVTFNDCAFTLGSIGPSSNLFLIQPIFNRCSWLDFQQVGGFVNDCAVTNGYATITQLPNISAGLWYAQSDIALAGILISGDTFITPNLIGNAPLTLGPANITRLTVSPGIGAGIQVQNFGAEASAIFINGDNALQAQGLIWGNGNSIGILVGEGVTATVGQTVGVTLPSITGASDFKFQTVDGNINLARGFDPATGALTEPGGVATRTTTWAHFAATLAAGGFHFAAFCGQSGAALVANV